MIFIYRIRLWWFCLKYAIKVEIAKENGNIELANAYKKVLDAAEHELNKLN